VTVFGRSSETRNDYRNKIRECIGKVHLEDRE
jgi:hypothetical protein